MEASFEIFIDAIFSAPNFSSVHDTARRSARHRPADKKRYYNLSGKYFKESRMKYF
jgi:hypothetical protein